MELEKGKTYYLDYSKIRKNSILYFYKSYYSVFLRGLQYEKTYKNTYLFCYTDHYGYKWRYSLKSHHIKYLTTTLDFVYLNEVQKIL